MYKLQWHLMSSLTLSCSLCVCVYVCIDLFHYLMSCAGVRGMNKLFLYTMEANSSYQEITLTFLDRKRLSSFSFQLVLTELKI